MISFEKQDMNCGYSRKDIQTRYLDSWYILSYPFVSWNLSTIDIHIAIRHSYPTYILVYPLWSTFYIQESYPQWYPTRISWLYLLYPIWIQDTYPYSISFVLTRPQAVILKYSFVSSFCIQATSPLEYPTLIIIDILKYPYDISNTVCSGAPLHTTAAEQKKVATLARCQGVAKMSWDPASNLHLPQTCHWESNPWQQH